MKFHPDLEEYAESLLDEARLIPSARKEKLARLADYISRKKVDGASVRLNFICTHNSRRSHLAQVWAASSAGWYALDGIHTYSGGTEATAFNPRAVAALERVGFRIENPGGDNPQYRVSTGQEGPELVCYSKTYDDPVNPREHFAAIMTCSEADENCPFIPGAEWRLSLPYDDPKAADGTPEEQMRYDERVRQIGREIFYAMYLVTTKLT